MFLDEARLAARLNHPNVVQTHEVGEEDDGRFFLAMEYLDGQSLATVLRQNGKSIPLDLQLRIICDALAGLHYAHELKNFDGKPLGIVHRDVSPQNIFITYTGQVKLLDFGIAKASSSEGKTQAGTLKGKIAFMAPEQVVGEGVDRRADIFSMGAMLWGAVSGTPMWAGLSDATIVKHLCSGNIPAPKNTTGDIPRELETIVAKALAADPADRYQTAADLRSDLEAFLTKRGARASAEDAGHLIQELFASERARVSKTIEEHMSVLEAQPNRDHTPIALPSGRPRPQTAAPSSNAVMVPVVVPVARAPGPAPATGRGWKLMAAVGGLAAVLLVGAVATGRLLVASAPEPAAAQVPAKPDEVEVDIRATPRDARFFLDDVPLGSNPYLGKRPRSTKLHELRIETPDGASETRTMVFDHDVRLELAISPRSPRWTP
jgi:serine/threonine-protein kinase